MKKVLASLILLMTCMVGCPPAPVIKDPTTPTDEDIQACKPGCEYLMTLTGRDGQPGCEEARPIIFNDGHVSSCQEFCEDIQRQGRMLNPKCWMTVQSCEEIEDKCR